MSGLQFLLRWSSPCFSAKDKQTLETKRKELNKLNQDLDRLKYEEGAFERLNEERQNLIREKNNAQGQVYNLNNR